MRRQDDVLPTLKLLVSDNDLSIVIPHVWYSQHPLMQAELEAESDCITKVGQTLHIAVN
jgi:exopolyphosphatase/guanosine-5'-triphosphate,3'-diphosphate pyrophosphatase